MKPGSIIRIVPDKGIDFFMDGNKSYPIFIIKHPEILSKEIVFPTRKDIPSNQLGFVVSCNDHTKMFDWLIEVCFPGINLQGWIEKSLLKPVSL